MSNVNKAAIVMVVIAAIVLPGLVLGNSVSIVHPDQYDVWQFTDTESIIWSVSGNDPDTTWIWWSPNVGADTSWFLITVITDDYVRSYDWCVGTFLLGVWTSYPLSNALVRMKIWEYGYTHEDTSQGFVIYDN